MPLVQVPQQDPDADQPSGTPPPMEIEPGAWLELEEERLFLEKYIADLQAQLAREADATARAGLRQQLRIAQMDYDQKQRETELALATSPVDFVAYEMYKRQLQKTAEQGVVPSEVQPDVAAAAQGWAEEAFGGGLGVTPPIMAQGPPTYDRPLIPEPLPHMVQPTQEGQIEYEYDEGGGSQVQYEPGWAPSGPMGTVHTDAEINAMLAEMTGVDVGGLRGAFNVGVPTTQQFSRVGFGEMSPDELAVLASFLRAGVGEDKVSIDPTEYFREMQEGFIPFMQKTGPTRYSF